MKEKIDRYLTKFKETEMKLEQTEKQREEEMRFKHNNDTIKRIDKLENVQRIFKMQDYQKQKLLEKIVEDNEKAEKIKYFNYNFLENFRL